MLAGSHSSIAIVPLSTCGFPPGRLCNFPTHSLCRFLYADRVYRGTIDGLVVVEQSQHCNQNFTKISKTPGRSASSRNSSISVNPSKRNHAYLDGDTLQLQLIGLLICHYTSLLNDSGSPTEDPLYNPSPGP